MAEEAAEARHLMEHGGYIMAEAVGHPPMPQEGDDPHQLVSLIEEACEDFFERRDQSPLGGSIEAQTARALVYQRMTVDDGVLARIRAVLTADEPAVTLKHYYLYSLGGDKPRSNSDKNSKESLEEEQDEDQDNSENDEENNEDDEGHIEDLAECAGAYSIFYHNTMNMDDRATNKQTSEEMKFCERITLGSAVPVRACSQAQNGWIPVWKEGTQYYLPMMHQGEPLFTETLTSETALHFALRHRAADSIIALLLEASSEARLVPDTFIAPSLNPTLPRFILLPQSWPMLELVYLSHMISCRQQH